MRNRLKILVAIMIVFCINIIFYFLSEDYRFFWEKIKNSGEVVYIEKEEITDEEETLSGAEVVVIPKSPSKNLITSLGDIKEIPKEPVVLPLQTEIFLGKNYQDILKKFDKYNLEKQEESFKLFGLTEEYPDPYIEYYGNDLTLYLFPTKQFRDVYDVFHVLIGELPVSLNEVDNFGEKSFYINLDPEISDDNVRLVISKNGIIFGLKIKKSEYNTVKNILLAE